MENEIKIIAAGSNELIAAEVEEIVRRIVGNDVLVIKMVSSSVAGNELADIFVCAVTQREVMLKKVPEDKLCVLDLRPTAQFFIEKFFAVLHISASETVYIFNSNKNYAELLEKMFREYEINQIHFETIAYEDMTEAEVIKKLRKARYIIGVGKIVGKEVLLSEKYRGYLRRDVEIIGRTRMATMQSACELIERLRSITGKKIDLNRQILDSLAGQLSDKVKIKATGVKNEYDEPEMADILKEFSHLNDMTI